jgi:hypothetical protein
MARQQLKVGDIVRVISYRPGKYDPGVTDDLGTEDLFKSMVGKRYRIRGFDQYGHLELRPKLLDTVWMEADLVELADARGKARNITQRSRRRRVRLSASRKRSAGQRLSAALVEKHWRCV